MREVNTADGDEKVGGSDRGRCRGRLTGNCSRSGSRLTVTIRQRMRKG
jgi:hypothetical protein